MSINTSLPSTIVGIQSAITNIVNEHGIDACATHCQSIYTGQFRSEPKFAKDLFHPSEYQELSESIKEEMISAAFIMECSDEINKFNSYLETCSDSDDSVFNQMSILEDSWRDNNDHRFSCPAISDDTLISELCNYKGEGDGVALYEKVKHLKVFISKYNYS